MNIQMRRIDPVCRLQPTVRPDLPSMFMELTLSLTLTVNDNLQHDTRDLSREVGKCGLLLVSFRMKLEQTSFSVVDFQ